MGTPWITSGATHQEFVTDSQEYVTDEAIAAHRLKLFPIGTLLVAMYGEGKTRGQVSELRLEATINQACAAIIVDETKAKKDFVKLALQANYMEMRELAEGGNQPNLNLSKIKEFPLSLPTNSEQIEIVRRVSILSSLLSRLAARIMTAQAIIDRAVPALLSQAFRGELVPQDPNDEPAAVLLDRIQKARAEQQEEKKRVPHTPSTKRTKIVAKTLQEIKPTHLKDTLLENGGKLTPEELLRLSELTLDDFYTQIKREMKTIRDVRPDDQTRFLEAIS